MLNWETMENNEKCSECAHKRKPKLIDRWDIESPCYTCVFNIHMVKTNNFSAGSSSDNIIQFLNPNR